MIQNLGTAWGSVRSKCIRYTGTRMYKYMKLTGYTLYVLFLSLTIILSYQGLRLSKGRYDETFAGEDVNYKRWAFVRVRQAKNQISVCINLD